MIEMEPEVEDSMACQARPSDQFHRPWYQDAVFGTVVAGRLEEQSLIQNSIEEIEWHL